MEIEIPADTITNHELEEVLLHILHLYLLLLIVQIETNIFLHFHSSYLLWLYLPYLQTHQFTPQTVQFLELVILILLYNYLHTLLLTVILRYVLVLLQSFLPLILINHHIIILLIIITLFNLLFFLHNITQLLI